MASDQCARGKVVRSDVTRRRARGGRQRRSALPSLPDCSTVPTGTQRKGEGRRGFAEHLSLTLSTTIDRGGESTLLKSLPYSHIAKLRQPAKPMGAMDASVLHVSLPGWTMPSVVSNSPLNFAHSSSKRTIAATTSVTHRRWNEKVCYVARSRHPRNLR